MSNGTQRQKEKKNKNRPKAGDVGYKSSMTMRKFAIKKIEPVDKDQQSLW